MSSTSGMAMRDSRAHASAGRTGVVERGGRRRGVARRAPRLAAECAERWDLRLGDPFEPATISLVVPAERRDGTPAVLKISFPESAPTEPRRPPSPPG